MSDYDVIVIGAGVIGCSVAYHLTKIGITDVVLCERQQLTSGTTWLTTLIKWLSACARLSREHRA
mgnify:CR=1 FL=1